MARPFLGNAYGNTDRSTPAQLLGGMAQSSSQAPIGTDQLQAPAIQAVQQLVETFSPAGRAPSLGGPVQLPTPPGVPQAQSPILSPLPRPMTPPNPVVMDSSIQAPQYAPYVDNMGALARSLSGFSTFFDGLTKYGVEREKRADERAKQQGGQLAMEASQLGTFTSLQEVQKRLEKGVAEGAAGYADMLRRFQAADPRALRYATVGLQDSYIKNNAATLAERVSQTKTLLDGRPIESVPANDPAYQQMQSALMFPNGTQGILPEVWAANQQQVGAIYGATSAAQEKRYGQYKTQKAKEGLAATSDANAANLVKGTLPWEQVSANLTNALDGFYGQSGQTRETYLEELSNFASGFIESALSVAGVDYTQGKQFLGKLPLVLTEVRVGPQQDGDKRPYLLDVIQAGPDKLSGAAALNYLMQEATKKVLGQQDLQDRLEGREASEQVDIDIQQAFTPDVLGNPQAIDMTEEALLARGRQLYGNNPEMALAYEERVKKHTSGIRAGYVQPVQEQNDLALWAQLADPRTAAGVSVEQVVQLANSQQISKAAANQALSFLRSSADSAANYNKQVLRDQLNDLTKRMEAQYARGGSDGGAVLTQGEAAKLRDARAALMKRGAEIIQTNPGQDVTQQLEQTFQKAAEKALPPEQPKPPAGATPEQISKGLAPGARGNPAQNTQLRRQAESRPLYARDRMVQQLEQVLTGKPLDNATRQIIRRTGMKPSEFFRKQMELHGVPMVPEAQKRLQELDGGDLVSQAPVGTGGFGMMPTNRYLPLAQRLGQQFATAFANVLVPPAAAAERGIRPFTGSPVVATGGMGGLLGMIRSGEGGWNSVNRGVAGDSAPIRNLTSMSIGVVEDMQKRGRVFAVGAYQFTPGVLSRARKEAGLSPNAPMTPENQNKMGIALLLGSKRPALAKYIRGESNDLRAAHLDIASEWAALQGPNGRGVYDGDKGGNMASIPAAQVRASLQEARRAYLSGRQ